MAFGFYRNRVRGPTRAMDFFQEREFIEVLGVSTEKKCFKVRLKGPKLEIFGFRVLKKSDLFVLVT